MRLNHLAAMALLSSAQASPGVIVVRAAEDPTEERAREELRKDEKAEATQKGTPSPRICSTEEAMERTGTSSPRAAKDAMSREQGRRLVYMPHVGAKQRAKAARALEREKAKAAT